MTERYVGAAELKGLSERVTALLRLRTLPVGMKLFEDPADMETVLRLRRPKAGVRHTMCQLVTQSRVAGLTLGITAENLQSESNCGGVPGLCQPSQQYLSGERFVGVWFENQEAARQHQAQMTRVPSGRYGGVVISPLRAARLDPPEIVLFYGTPGQMILFINGLQWKQYRRYDFTITGETACADSWGRALATGETSLSIPCFAERRYGGVADDELLMALPPDEFARGIEGIEGLNRSGIRYPIMPYGPQSDPADGMAVSYGDKPA